MQKRGNYIEKFKIINIKMYILTLLEIILVTIYCAKLINNICCKDVNFIVKVTCLISWLTNFILLILLPLDIYITFRDLEVYSN